MPEKKATAKPKTTTSKTTTAKKTTAKKATTAKKEASPAPAKKASSKKKVEKEILMYNGKPLVRCGNEIYYGNPEDEYIVTFRLDTQDPLGDLEIAKHVVIELKANIGGQWILNRQAERAGLYKAFDLGMFWLEQALGNV